jgi:hypothetical protein
LLQSAPSLLAVEGFDFLHAAMETTREPTSKNKMPGRVFTKSPERKFLGLIG